MIILKKDCGCANSGLNGLGFVEYITAATALYGAATKKGGGGSSDGGAPGNIVSTNVNTQVSPQISPVFVQQDSPTNSPVTAGIGMGVPQTGNMPYFDTPRIPQLNTAQINPWVVGGLALTVLALFSMKKKKAA